jgi:hypothetical protein
MSKRLFGREAIAFARAHEADDMLVRDADGEWAWTSVADAVEAQERAEDEGVLPIPRVVMIDSEE